MTRWIRRLAWMTVGSLLTLNFVMAHRDRQHAVAAAQPGVTVTLRELTISPSSIPVTAGQPATLLVHNAGQAEHSLVVDVGTTTVQTPLVAPGASATLELPALAAGSHPAWCGVPGHREAGMTATVVASATAASAQAASTGGSMQGMGMGAMTAEQMAASHKQSMTAFPAKTAVTGGQLLPPGNDHGTLVFHLVARETRWEVSPGTWQDAFAYNGQVPGPELRVHQGDRVRIVLQNQLPQPTVVHFHGLTVPNADDGVPYITQPPVMPGRQFTYEFTVRDQPGTYMYHSHFNSAEQVGRGLFGAFVVEPAKPSWDREYTEILSDGQLGYAINGKGWPATTPLVAKRGERVLIRMVNAGELLHPFHLHGYHFLVLAKDGTPERSPYAADTLVVAPGERYDVLVDATEVGVWAFHCHILSHVEGPQGMFGMATALIVK